eukprot:6154045-Ditylum_brightwellii.AAC.1
MPDSWVHSGKQQPQTPLLGQGTTPLISQEQWRLSLPTKGSLRGFGSRSGISIGSGGTHHSIC